jgi:hypothetical protein
MFCFCGLAVSCLSGVVLIAFMCTLVLDTGEDGQGAEGQVAAMYGWSDHTLPVTGLLAGAGGSSAIVVSCSLDHTCKVTL